MKVEFELTLNNNGSPAIQFRHHDKSDALEQKVLKIFIDSILEKGCLLVNTKGYCRSGSYESWEDYQIQVNTLKQ
jgi:hypothetical protein|tara:strand:+ start:57 stop:281 length:225 start_codon:yes stop_codon:yes gene_type:complete